MHRILGFFGYYTLFPRTTGNVAKLRNIIMPKDHKLYRCLNLNLNTDNVIILWIDDYLSIMFSNYLLWLYYTDVSFYYNYYYHYFCIDLSFCWTMFRKKMQRTALSRKYYIIVSLKIWPRYPCDCPCAHTLIVSNLKATIIHTFYARNEIISLQRVGPLKLTRDLWWLQCRCGCGVLLIIFNCIILYHNYSCEHFSAYHGAINRQ